MDSRWLPPSVTIACSAALLFVIQPIVAKSLLPRFGGSAGVWVTCMMFFQIVLLLGYLYSFWITRFPGPKVRTAVHLTLLALSLSVLPLRSAALWSAGNPTFGILRDLAATAGLPFFLLSTTNPLVQSWCAQFWCAQSFSQSSGAGSRGERLPYRLFAVSNTACLLALLAYPVAIEPALAAPAQLRWWSAGYLAAVLLIAGGAIYHRRWTYEDERDTSQPGDTSAASAPDRPFLWIGLAACASTLWLAVSNYLSQEVAAIPFLWVLPLTLYLLSFVLCFDSDGPFESNRWYRPALFRWLLPAAWVAIGSRIGVTGASGDLRVDIPLMLSALFILCLFCHGELARTKPVRRQGLAFFYLTIAAGGALGGVFVGFAAPNLFSTFLELPIGIVGSVFLSLVLIYGIVSPGRLIRLAALAIAAFVAASSFHGGTTNVVSERNFYGTLQIRDSGEGDIAARTLYNGRTAHGMEFLSAWRRDTPASYYGKQSGIGLLFSASNVPNRRVAIIGLGTGTLAAYGRKGDFFRFYEINPAVIHAASTYFHFLEDSAASTDVVAGDGRLRLEQEPPQSFDLIVLDAFSDDTIPIHLLTREAFQVYFARLRAGRPLAIHVTNRYLDLNPVVESLAAAFQKRVLQIHSPSDPEDRVVEANWDIVSGWDETTEKLRAYADPGPGRRGPLWTDDYSNLFQIWR